MAYNGSKHQKSPVWARLFLKFRRNLHITYLTNWTFVRNNMWIMSFNTHSFGLQPPNKPSTPYIKLPTNYTIVGLCFL